MLFNLEKSYKWETLEFLAQGKPRDALKIRDKILYIIKN